MIFSWESPAFTRAFYFDDIGIFASVFEEPQSLQNEYQIFVKMFAYDFFNKSDGGEIFLFLLKHAFKTKTLHLSVWKKTAANSIS